MAIFRNHVLLLVGLAVLAVLAAAQTRGTQAGDDDCPPLSDQDSLTQDQFVASLTDPCRYDKLIKPTTDGPLPVYVQIDLNHVESADQVTFKAYMLVQYRYNDDRLRYEEISPARGAILGEQPLRDKIWVPHMIIRNERDTTIMGIDGKDVFIMISPAGDVVYSSRMVATFYCWMDLKKFPFDTQDCALMWNSWTYNVSNLVLRWDEELPVRVADNLHLTEFVMTHTWAQETEVPASFTKGALVGNFSELVFKFRLAREVGYYIMDYFLPSILLVCTSWVTFWLQADAGPPRATLGTSTTLAFITLSGGLTANLPKVSYIKASDIWFLACSCFIFGSLAEFAFVNVIWRRKKIVELKKQTRKHIIKGAFAPSVARKHLRKAESVHSIYRPQSYTTIDDKANYLSGFPDVSMAQSQDDLIRNDVTSVQMPEEPAPAPTWHKMTPQEVAIWVDRKSRIVFPVAFIIFNAFYWTFVYIL